MCSEETVATGEIQMGIRRVRGVTHDSAGDLLKDNITPYSISPIPLYIRVCTMGEYRNITTE